MKKMRIGLLLILAILVACRVRDMKAASAQSLDTDNQQLEVIGEPRQQEAELEEEEAGTDEEAEPEKETKKKSVKQEQEEEEEIEIAALDDGQEEVESPGNLESKTFSEDERGAILLCILFCVALIAGYLLIGGVLKK